MSAQAAVSARLKSRGATTWTQPYVKVFRGDQILCDWYNLPPA